MSKLKQKFLEVYSVSTLRDVDYLGGTPDKNALLKFSDTLQKWVPSKLNVIFASIQKNPTESFTIEENEYLVMKDPDIADKPLIVEGDLVVI